MVAFAVARAEPLAAEVRRGFLSRLLRSMGAAAGAAWPALAGYTLVRGLGLLTLLVWAEADDRSFFRLLSRSDGDWYVSVVEHGYDHAERLQSNLAFFPLFPALTWCADPVVPGGPRVAAVVVAWLASLAAAWALFAIGNHLGGRRVGILLAVAWGVVPHAVVESMAYTEGLFTALTAWSLFALLRGRWVTSGFLCLLAGLTRPTVALIPVVILAAVIAIVRRRDGWRPWAALILAPAGWLGYLAWVAIRTHRVDGWFYLNSRGWGASLDGVYTVRSAAGTIIHNKPLDFRVVTLVLAIALVLFVLSVRDRQPWPLLLFSALLLATALSVDHYNAKARLLIPAFPLLLPFANALARMSWAKSCMVLAALAGVASAFGGYLLLIWPNSP